MANDEKTTQSLDADILQCKADILKALRANIPAVSEDLDLGDDTPDTTAKASDVKPPQQPTSVSKPEIIEANFEPEVIKEKPPVQETKHPPIRIMPFETTQQPAPAPKPVEAAKPQAAEKTAPAPVEKAVAPVAPKAPVNEKLESELREKLKDAQIQNAALNKQIDSLRQAAEQTSKQLSDVKTSLKLRLQTATTDFNQQTQKLTSERDALRNQLVSQENLLDQFKQLQLQLTELRQLEQANTELQQKLADRESSLDQSNQSQNQLTEQLAKIQKEKDQTQNQLDNINKEYEDHKLRAEEALQAARKEKEQLAQTNQALAEKSASMMVQLEELNQEQANLNTYQDQARRLRSELTETEAALSQERVRIRQMESEIKLYNEQKTSLDQSQEDMNEQLGLAEDEKRALLDDRESLQKDFTNFQMQASREIAHLSEKMVNTRDEKQLLQDDLEQLKAEHEAYLTQANGEIGQLTDKNSELKSENERLYESISQLSHEISILKTKAETLEKQSAQLETLNSELQHSRLELSSQCETEDKLRSEIIALQQQSDSLTAEQDHLIEKLKNENQMLIDLNSQLQNELIVLQDNIAPSEDTPAEEIVTQNDDRQPAWDDETSEQLEDILNNASHDDLQIPSFNLADQIMAEHRRNVAIRRQRVKSTETVAKDNSIRGVVQQYVKTATHQEVKTAGKENAHYDLWKNDSLSPFQQDILQEIVQKDIELFTHHNVGINRAQSLMYY